MTPDPPLSPGPSRGDDTSQAPTVGPGPSASVDGPTISVGEPVDNKELSELHRRAFGAGPSGEIISWDERLARHSLFWLTARRGGRLVGFVNVIADGGEHAVLLDLVVDPDHQGQGIGAGLVRAAAERAGASGCAWLHADYEQHNAGFYERACGMRPTRAGLLRLR